MSSSSQVVPNTPDVLVRNEGTVFLFCPLTSRGKQWIEEHVQPDAQWFGSALIVEHRFAWGLAQGLKEASRRARVVALGICRDCHAGADSRYRVAHLPRLSPASG